MSEFIQIFLIYCLFNQLNYLNQTTLFLGEKHVFQRELSIIDFTLNYPPIRNNLTSVSLLSMLIETDYLNYPPIRNNLTSACLLSMIIEMDYNLLGMKARTVPRRRAEICRARNIFFPFPEH